jgi:hypothetical protein
MNAAQVRRTSEIALPGFAIGMAAGVLIGLLGLLGGMPAGQILVAVLVLGIPLALAGALYDGLLVAGRMGIGTFAPAVVFWLLVFPLARFLNEMLSDVLAGDSVTLPGGVGGFFAYQALLSMGYAIGFVFLHEQVAPLWWLRVKAHNPAAERLVERYMAHAAFVYRGRRQRGRVPGPAPQSQRTRSPKT